MSTTFNEERDPDLWLMAKKRVAFRSHLFTYLVINGFLWALWYFSGNRFKDDEFPWPLWTTLGWGIGIAFHFASAFLFPKVNTVEKEYQKLKTKKSKIN